MARLLIVDDFLPDPHKLRQEAMAQPFGPAVGPDDEVYQNVGMRPTEEFADLIAARVGRSIVPRYAFLRFGNSKEPLNCDIHADAIVEEFAALLYLSLPEHCQGGTAFWRHKKTGYSSLPTEADIRRIGKSPRRIEAELRADATDHTKWNLDRHVDMKLNRLVIYPTKQFHSRWPVGGFGGGLESSRLTWHSFFRTV